MVCLLFYHLPANFPLFFFLFFCACFFRTSLKFHSTFVYKIGSTCIANRLKRVLPSLISEDQTGFMANRYIGDNIRLIYDLISYLNKENMPGLLLCLDFEKAFDSVDWRFMFKVLHAFGFGPDINQWIFTFYRHIKSSVAVNGQLSEWFSIQRGCRQGDPIS